MKKNFKPILKSYLGRVFFEFLCHENPSDTILILEGFPAQSEHPEQIEFLYKKGYNVIWPHYPGTYQSEGKFLDKNPILEFSEFIDKIQKEETIINLWDMTEVKIKSKKLFLFGSSFSGPICCGVANNLKVDGIVLFSPVWDFSKHNKNGDEQDLDKLVSFVKRAYKYLFRFEWNSLPERMSNFKECDPDNYIKNLKCPLLVFHDTHDKSVSFEKTIQMKKLIPPMKIIKSNLGHGMSKILLKEWKEINEFLRR